MLRRRILLATLAAVIAAGCAGVQRVEEVPAGPFQIALMATTDTRGELEPCG